MKCIHERTYKLFYMSCNPRKWVRTNYSVCQKCGEIIIKSAMKVNNTLTKSEEEKKHGKSIRRS